MMNERLNKRLSHLTDDQKRAVITVDRSILVSAAAGSGKTTVLAERCAALVCDLPSDQRCRIDEILVVTFTDAAAGEMRSRIGKAIKQRLSDAPRDQYLQQQLYLLDSASISTIHSFCRTLIQRWFPQAEVDPQAAILAGDEAELLRREVLDALFMELYAGEDELSRLFQTLVDDYGAGSDRAIIKILLQVHDYLCSLPDPDQWLADTVDRLDSGHSSSIIAELDHYQYVRLRDELDKQIEYGGQTASMIRHCWPIAEMHAEAVEEHVVLLTGWRDKLVVSPKSWEQVAGEIREFKFERAKSKPRNLPEEESAAYDAAKLLRDKIKNLFVSRIAQSICSFTADEYRDGLIQIAPYVGTLTELVKEFDQRYQAAKSAQGAVDFNDLQRCALKLLTEKGDTDYPSEVARQLQQQYRYVLVDEFQDIDPLQEAILRLVSRESAYPPQGNLFTVGDIKQSIYRFRLAEPILFSNRAEAFGSDQSAGELIHLQQNFRSRASIIDAINTIFQPLMHKSFGGSDYDKKARLYAGADYPHEAQCPIFNKPAIELHLLEPITESTRRNDDDDSDTENDEIELEGIEREAFLMGRKIQQWMGRDAEARRWHVSEKPKSPDVPPATRPIEYRDIVILLRALPHKAEPIADVLRRMGIPVQVERGNNSMDTTEFRDLISLLMLLDNQQQDIPLAALLRSPLLGDPFDETDLLNIRLPDRSLPFHKAVQRYAQRGADEALRERLNVVLAKIERYRGRIQREPVAEVLWDIYQQSQYLAYVAGLPDGARRREHLIQFHELARQFSHFARQGLRRFLRFIEDLLENERGLQQTATAGAEDNVVRIMTVHASKGLEFPVVILADLQKKFNLTDTTGTVLVDRELGLAMRAADPEKRIYYPTFLHQFVSERTRRENLSEELRVLYVALTRAREHLMLVGRYNPKDLDSWQAMHDQLAGRQTALPQLQLEIANNPLDWLLPAISTQELFKINFHGREKTDQWRIPPAVEPVRSESLVRIANLEPLPKNEPIDNSDEPQKIMNTLSFHYPALELTTMPARVSVSELKRRWNTSIDPDERLQIKDYSIRADRPAFVDEGVTDDAALRGMATHRFLQHIDLTRSCDAADLKQQCETLVAQGRLTSNDAEMVMLDAAAWFFSTDLGKQIQAQAANLQREVVFVSRVSPDQYDPSLSAHDHRDMILLRGVVDLLLPRDSHLEILDYKTDAVESADIDSRAEKYRQQLRYYASAMEGIYQLPVAKQWLVFLHPQRIVEVSKHEFRIT